MTDLSNGVPSQRVASVTTRMAEHVAARRLADLPSDAIGAAKLFLLDTLAVAWAGSDAPGCPQAHDLLCEEGGRPDSTAWAFGGWLPASAAAFVNGMTSSALDYDALGRDAPVHVNVVVAPAAFAVAQREHCTGEELLAALVLGSDIAVRIAAASRHPPTGFHLTSTAAAIGGAAAAARLLRLDATGIRHALAIAFTQAAGTKQVNIEPCLAKRTLAAFAARASVFSALLAQRGITAPREAIEGTFGYARLIQDCDLAVMLEGLGERYDNTRLSIKKFPSCGCNHTTLAAVLRLVRAHDLAADDVTAVEVTVTPEIERLVGMPYDPSGDAQVAAQFSIRYSVACALVRRRLGLAEIQEDAARDPSIAAHIPKVTLRVDATHRGSRGPVVVRLRTRTHGELVGREEHVPGSLEAPLCEPEIDDKIDECLGLGVRPLDAERITLLKGRVRALEHVSDMARFFAGVLAPRIPS